MSVGDGWVAGGPRFVRRRWSWHRRKWLERATSRWAARGSSVGGAAGGPRFVRASWSWHWRKGPERAVRPWAICGSSGGGHRFGRAAVVMALPERTGAGGKPVAVSGPSGGGACGGLRFVRASPCCRAFGVWRSYPAIASRTIRDHPGDRRAWARSDEPLPLRRLKSDYLPEGRSHRFEIASGAMQEFSPLHMQCTRGKGIC